VPQTLRIAALQPKLRHQQPMPNMFDLRKTIENLPQALDIVILPETWTGIPPTQWNDSLTEKALQFLQNLGRTSQINVVGGTIVQQDKDGKRHIVTPIVDRQGNLVGQYAKQTLFGQEQDVFTPGNRTNIFDLGGIRVGVLVCADLWRGELAQNLRGQIDILCVTAKTSTPSDEHVLYARQLWHSLALTRAMENGFPVVVSDWASGRHTPKETDLSIGSPHAPGMEFDRGVLYKRHRDKKSSPTSTGPTVPTAKAHTATAPGVGWGVHYTAGAASMINPGRRPDITKVFVSLPRGEPGVILEEINLEETHKYVEYRQNVGILPSKPPVPGQ